VTGRSTHYRKRVICRVPNSLPCAKIRAHGKQTLCREPKIKHTANTTHTAKFPICRAPIHGTHGKNKTHGILQSLPCATVKAHGKLRARATHVRSWRTEVDGGAAEVDGAQLCRVPQGAQGKHANSPCATPWHTANSILRRVLSLGTRQTVYFWMCLKLFPASCDIYVICNACDIYVVIWGPLYVKNKKE